MASAAVYRAASQRGAQVISVRGGDFLAPEVGHSFWTIVTLKALAKGKITTLTRPEVTRACAPLPDMARIAVALAEQRAERATLFAFLLAVAVPLFAASADSRSDPQHRVVLEAA